MLRADQVTDLETARTLLRLYEQETERLYAKLAKAITELARLKGQDGKQQLELKIAELQQELSVLRQKTFGTSSEKRPGPEGKEGEATAPKTQTGHGPREQLMLPIEEVAVELDEADRVCTLCGEKIESWDGQSEDSEEITVVERHFVIRKIRRQKYRCEKGCAPVTAPAPPKLASGGRYSISFAVYIAIQKYLDHLPLERQVRMYLREGLVIDSQTLWDQLDLLATHLSPSYQALADQVFRHPVIHADETPWLLLNKGPSKRWYAWTVASPDAVMYRILPSRSAASAKDVLGDYRGVVLVDGYGAYQTAVRAGPGEEPRFVLAFCWAHVRR